MIRIDVRFKFGGNPPEDRNRLFRRMPAVGELIEHEGRCYRIDEIIWREDSSPLVLARSGVGLAHVQDTWASGRGYVGKFSS